MTLEDDQESQCHQYNANDVVASNDKGKQVMFESVTEGTTFDANEDSTDCDEDIGSHLLDAVEIQSRLHASSSLIKSKDDFRPRGVECSSPNGTRYWNPETNNKLSVGIAYATINEAYEAYKEYAFDSGFEVRQSTSRKVNGIIVSKYFVCNKEGKNIQGKDNDIVDVDGCNRNERKARSIRTIRTSCPAMVRFILDTNTMYILDTLVEKHNHKLISVEHMPLLKSCRKMGFSQQLFVHQLSNYNLGPNRSFKVMSQLAGGSSKVGASVVDCKNFKRDVLQFIGEGDVQMAIQKLMYKKACVDGFSFDYLCALDGTLSGIFWADPIAKHNFDAFGDIISFDATFRTNKYSMVFVPFTGIDNHKKSVNFGAGLLSNETTQSYVWLLNAFLSAFKHQPKVVVTDQDPAMKQAIEEVFPQSRHRWCMWHIMTKLTDKVGSHICKKTDFRQRFSDLVWNDILEEDAFENGWAELINQHKLPNQSWFTYMFKERHHWVPAFFRFTYLSGLMRTTSRSESENNFFQQVLSNKITLLEFLSHFETAIDFQRAAQRHNDLLSFNKHIELKTKLNIEKNASVVYSLSIFELVQDEIVSSVHYCIVETVDNTEDMEIFSVRDVSNASNATLKFKVRLNNAKDYICCSCTLFERMGYLCRHCFCVFRVSCVDEIPAAYILKRWRKGVIQEMGCSLTSIESSFSNNGLQDMFREIIHDLHGCLNRIICFNDLFTLFREQHKQFLDDFVKNLPMSNEKLNKNEVISALLGVSRPKDINIRPPTGVRNKGCGKRLISIREQSIVNASKRERLCGFCNTRGSHDSRNCPQKQAKK